MKYLKRMKKFVLHILIVRQDNQSPYLSGAMKEWSAARLSDALADTTSVPWLHNVNYRRQLVSYAGHISSDRTQYEKRTSGGLSHVSKHGISNACTNAVERGYVSKNTVDPMTELSLAALDRFDFGGTALGFGIAPWEFS